MVDEGLEMFHKHSPYHIYLIPNVCISKCSSTALNTVVKVQTRVQLANVRYNALTLSLFII